MNNIDITKSIVGFAVGSGVAKIVKDVIANNINAPEKTVTKLVTYAGGAVIGMMAKDATKAYASTKIDSYVATFKEAKEKRAKADDDKQNKIIDAE